jgi:hypothetical protein
MMLCVNSVSIDLLVIYRPPLNCINRFFTEFNSLLERLPPSTKKTLLMGDFNIHVDNVDENVPALFSSLLKSFGWCQHAKGPTHTEGHTLDLFFRVWPTTCSLVAMSAVFSVINWPLRYWYELIALFGREKSSLSDQLKKIILRPSGVTCWSCR